MNEKPDAWGLLHRLTWEDVLIVVGALLASHLLVVTAQTVLSRLAEKAPPRRRMDILRMVPIVRLLIRLAAVAVIVPLLVEPTFRNVAALLAGLALVLAFALKDFAGSVAAGVVAVLENAYQPGDWIEVDGVYGEVKAILMRSVRVVTPDDTEVIIPHSRIWSGSVFNASGGSRSILCAADFHLHPDHDAFAVRARLAETGETSPYRKPETPVVVIIQEKPWGTHYRLKATVRESREQFLFITDLTMRGKEALRGMGVRFAQAPVAVEGR